MSHSTAQIFKSFLLNFKLCIITISQEPRYSEEGRMNLKASSQQDPLFFQKCCSECCRLILKNNWRLIIKTHEQKNLQIGLSNKRKFFHSAVSSFYQTVPSLIRNRRDH